MLFLGIFVGMVWHYFLLGHLFDLQPGLQFCFLRSPIQVPLRSVKFCYVLSTILTQELNFLYYVYVGRAVVYDTMDVGRAGIWFEGSGRTSA